MEHFGKQKAWKGLLINNRFPEAVPWTWGTGTSRCSLGVPLPPPRPGGTQLWLCMNWDKPTHWNSLAPRWNSPIVPGLGPAPAASQLPSPAPSAPSGCAVLGCPECPVPGAPQPQGTTSAGPGAPSPPGSHNTRDHPGTTPGPPRALQRLLPPHIGSSGGATPTPKPWATPAPAGAAPREAPGLAVPLDLHFSLSVSWCKRPPPH